MTGTGDDGDDGGGELQVLQVDRDTTRLATMASYVARERADLRVTSETDGAAGRETLDGGAFDCLLVDHGAPEAESLVTGADLPVVLYTDDPATVETGLLGHVDALLEADAGCERMALFAETVGDVVRRRSPAGDLAAAFAGDGSAPPVRTAQWLVYEDGTVVWASDDLETVLPAEDLGVAIPESENFYERLTVLVANDPEAVRAVRSSESTDSPITVRVPTAAGDAYFQYREHALPESVGPLRLAVLTDVTDAVRRRAARDALERLVDGAGNGLFALDADGTVTYANDAFAALLGSRPDDVVGTPADDCFADGEHDRCRDAVERLVDDGPAAATLDVAFAGPDGELTAPVDLAAIARDGAVDGLVGIVRTGPDGAETERTA